MGDGLKGALAHADAAFLTDRSINLQLAVHHPGSLGGAAFFNLTDSAAAAHIVIEHGHLMALHTEVIQGWLHAAVGAAAHGNFKLVGQLHVVPADIVVFMNLLCQFLGIIIAVDTGGTFAGHNRAHLSPGAAEAHTALCSPGPGLLNLLKGNAGDLHRQAAGADQLAVAKGGGQLCHVLKIFSAKNGAGSYDAAGEQLRASVKQKALGFDRCNISCF